VVRLAIKLIKESQDVWSVWNNRNGKLATIISIQEFGYLATNKKKYRVDVNGKTIRSMIDHFQKAKAIATKHVKGEIA
jgi:hypothetical protein